MTIQYKLLAALLLIAAITASIMGYGHNRYIEGKAAVQKDWDADKVVRKIEAEKQAAVTKKTNEDNQSALNKSKKIFQLLVLSVMLLLGGCETFQICQGEKVCSWQAVDARQCPAWPQIPGELVSVSKNESVAARILEQNHATPAGNSSSKP